MFPGFGQNNIRVFLFLISENQVSIYLIAVFAHNGQQGTNLYRWVFFRQLSGNNIIILTCFEIFKGFGLIVMLFHRIR